MGDGIKPHDEEHENVYFSPSNVRMISEGEWTGHKP
jgi:hypothetical protein